MSWAGEYKVGILNMKGENGDIDITGLGSRSPKGVRMSHFLIR